MARKIAKPVDKARNGRELATGIRHCVSCGRQIDWNSEVCPYCGHDFQKAISAIQGGSPLEETLSGGVRAVVYGVSVLFPIVGFLLGGYLMSRPSPQVYKVGKVCVFLAFVPTLLLLGLGFVASGLT